MLLLVKVFFWDNFLISTFKIILTIQLMNPTITRKLILLEDSIIKTEKKKEKQRRVVSKIGKKVAKKNSSPWKYESYMAA